MPRKQSPGLAVSVQNLSCHYGRLTAVDDVTIEVAAGEFVSLLGPSGSGKTTLLMSVAGFQKITSGRIVIGEREISNVPAHKRELGVVFQRYALFPHMTVQDNVAYALKMRGVPSGGRTKQTEDALELVGLEGLGARKPAQLSGGQQQRVALARVLVYRPPIILFDEPLSALDRKLREQVQLEIRRLNKELGITMLFVTHDQEEALIMSDKIALLRDGKLEQYGTGRQLYDRPNTEFAAGFLGRTNLLAASVTSKSDHRISVSLGGHVTEASWREGLDVFAPGATCRVAIRPENIAVSKDRSVEGLDCVIRDVVFSGATTFITGEVAGQEVLIQGLSTDQSLEVQPGEEVRLRIGPQSISILPA